MKRLIASIASIVVVAIVACGDHVTVPADKTGKCVAGLLTKCGDTCVDTTTDIQNCGACGAACTGAKICVQGKCTDSCPPGSTRCGDACVNIETDRTNCGMCSKACAVNEICAKGKCAASCEAAGYTTCSGMTGTVDAGGAMNCVDTTSDGNNCGTCGHACMASEGCTNGVCCPTGQIACNGQCIDPMSDANNCGSCGTVCSMAAPTCVVGACSKCNNNVLVIADNQTAINTQLKKVFQAANFNTTVVDNGWTTYTGTPAATGFGAVLVFPGANYLMDMPASGQQALVTAQTANVGFVVDGFISLEVQQGRFQTAKAINLTNYGVNTVFSLTLVANQSQPWFFGIPTSFAPVNQTLWFCGGNLGGTQFAQVAAGSACATFGNSTTWIAGINKPGNGRIAQLMYGMSYSGAGTQWTNDPNMNGFVINAVRWAASCTN